MARDFGPFPSKPMYEVVNRRMQRALALASQSTGFVASGQGAVTAGTGAQLAIAAYPDGALVDGLYVENPASETVTLTTNSNANPRIDRLVLRLDMAAETIAPFQIVGTPAASPSAPSLTSTATVVDMPLCQYRFPGSASAQNPGSIVDERTYLKTRNADFSSVSSNSLGILLVPHGLGGRPRTWGAMVGAQVSEGLSSSLRLITWESATDATNIAFKAYNAQTGAIFGAQPINLHWWAEL